MALATWLYVSGVMLFILFTDALFGVSGQSLAYGPLTAALVVLLLQGMTRGPRNFLQLWYVSGPMMLPGALFLTGLAISMPNAHEVGLAAKDFLRWSFVWLAFAPATRAICSTPERCRLMTRIAAGLIVAFAAVAAGDLITGGTLTPRLIGREGITAAGRYMSVYGNPGIFAGMLTVGLPLSLMVAMRSRRWPAKLGWGAGTALIFAGMLLTGSRITLATAAVACLVIFLTERRWWALAGASVVFAAAMLTPVSALLGGAPTVARVEETVSGVGSGERSLQRRLLIWSVALEIIREHPVFGAGGAQLRFAQHAGFKRAHNAWLDAWLDGGLPAALAMLVVTGLVLGRAWRTLTGRVARYRHPTHIALVAASCAVLVGWTVRAGIGGRIDWLPVFLLFAGCWDLAPAPEEQPAGWSSRPSPEPCRDMEVLPHPQGS